jgi:hypothetical protein
MMRSVPKRAATKSDSCSRADLTCERKAGAGAEGDVDA